jgi:hypothetical protein
MSDKRRIFDQGLPRLGGRISATRETEIAEHAGNEQSVRILLPLFIPDLCETKDMLDDPERVFTLRPSFGSGPVFRAFSSLTTTLLPYLRWLSSVTDRLLPRLLSFEALDEVRIR